MEGMPPLVELEYLMLSSELEFVCQTFPHESNLNS